MPDASGKFVVANLLIENASRIPNPLNASILIPKLIDADNNELPCAWVILKMDLSEPFAATLDPGAKAHVRVIFRAASMHSVPSSLTIKDQQFSGRSVKIQLAN